MQNIKHSVKETSFILYVLKIFFTLLLTSFVFLFVIPNSAYAEPELTDNELYSPFDSLDELEPYSIQISKTLGSDAIIIGSIGHKGIDEDHDDSVTISGLKPISNNEGIYTEEFPFRIEGPNGFKSDFTVKMFSKRVWKNLPPGEYTITELPIENPYSFDKNDRLFKQRSLNPIELLKFCDGDTVEWKNTGEIYAKVTIAEDAASDCSSKAIQFVNVPLDFNKIQAEKVWKIDPELFPDSEPTNTWFQLIRENPLTSELKKVGDPKKVEKNENGRFIVTWQNGYDGLEKDAIKRTVHENGKQAYYKYYVQEVDEHGKEFTPKGFLKYEDGNTIFNFPKPTVDITAKKQILNIQTDETSAPEGDAFSFKLTKKDSDEESLIENNNSEGIATFKNIDTPDKIGKDYAIVYILEEVIPSDDKKDDSLIYDESIFEVQVYFEVENGELVIKKDIYKVGEEDLQNEALFTNQNKQTVSWTPFATKELLGRDLVEGEFKFTLFLDGDEIETTTNTSYGRVAFSEITYNESDVGEYTYTIKEQNNSLDGVTYDDKEIKIVVTVSKDENGKLSLTKSYSDDTTFTNTYDKPDEPKEPSDPNKPEEPKKHKINDNAQKVNDNTIPKTNDISILNIISFLLG